MSLSFVNKTNNNKNACFVLGRFCLYYPLTNIYWYYMHNPESLVVKIEIIVSNFNKNIDKQFDADGFTCTNSI